MQTMLTHLQGATLCDYKKIENAVGPSEARVGVKERRASWMGLEWMQPNDCKENRLEVNRAWVITSNSATLHSY